MDNKNGPTSNCESGQLSNGSVGNVDRMSVSSTDRHGTPLTYQEKVARARIFQEEEARKKFDEYERNIRKIEEARNKVNSDRQRKIDEIKRRDLEHRRKVAERRLENEKANIERVTRIMERSRDRNNRPGPNLMLASCYVPGSQANKVNANRDPSGHKKGFFMTMGREESKMTGLGSRANSSHSLHRTNSRVNVPRNADRHQQVPGSGNLVRAQSAMSFAQPTQAFLNRINSKTSASNATGTPSSTLGGSTNRIAEKRRSMDEESISRNSARRSLYMEPLNEVPDKEVLLRPPIPVKKPLAKPQPPKPKPQPISSQKKEKQALEKPSKDNLTVPTQNGDSAKPARDSPEDIEAATKNTYNNTQSAISEIKSEDSFNGNDNKSSNLEEAFQPDAPTDPIQEPRKLSEELAMAEKVVEVKKEEHQPVKEEPEKEKQSEKEHVNGHQTEQIENFENRKPETSEPEPKPITPIKRIDSKADRLQQKNSIDRKDSLMTASMTASMTKFQAEVTGSGEGGDLSDEAKLLYREKMTEMRRIAREKKLEEEARLRAKREEEERIKAEERAEQFAKARAAQDEMMRKQEEEIKRVEMERKEREDRERREREEKENREKREKEERELKEKEERKQKLANIMSRVKSVKAVTTKPTDTSDSLNGDKSEKDSGLGPIVLPRSTQNGNSESLSNNTRSESISLSSDEPALKSSNPLVQRILSKGPVPEVNNQSDFNDNLMEKENNYDEVIPASKTKFQHPLLKAMQDKGRFQNAKTAIEVMKKNLDNRSDSVDFDTTNSNNNEVQDSPDLPAPTPDH